MEFDQQEVFLEGWSLISRKSIWKGGVGSAGSLFGRVEFDQQEVYLEGWSLISRKSIWKGGV